MYDAALLVLLATPRVEEEDGKSLAARKLILLQVLSSFLQRLCPFHCLLNMAYSHSRINIFGCYRRIKCKED